MDVERLLARALDLVRRIDIRGIGAPALLLMILAMIIGFLVVALLMPVFSSNGLA